jgi:hypothetical protein
MFGELGQKRKGYSKPLPHINYNNVVRKMYKLHTYNINKLGRCKREFRNCRSVGVGELRQKKGRLQQNKPLPHIIVRKMNKTPHLQHQKIRQM